MADTTPPNRPSLRFADYSPSETSSSLRAHLIGAAGCGMRALSEVLLEDGWTLTGSDLSPPRTEPSDAFAGWICEGHAVGNVPPDADLVVYSDAVPADNPELVRAKEFGIPTKSYFQMLGQLSAERNALAVAGTHGKSTTTAMAAAIFALAGRDPTVVSGATPLGRSSGGRGGRSDLMLVEACEYRANFLHLQPRQAVLLGIEPDHFDFYRHPHDLHQAFSEFAQSVPGDGLVLARHDCSATRRAAAGLACRVETFAVGSQASWSARIVSSRQGRYRFTLHHYGRHVCEVGLRVPGKHNVLNALAAAALAGENGVAPSDIARALRDFRGLHRRLESLGTVGGVVLLDDYAHHPTEVAVTLETVRRMYPRHRVWAVFQPHQVSRTAHLMDELAASLQNADKVLITEIFRAREGAPVAGEITAADLARRTRAAGMAVADVHSPAEIGQLLQSQLGPGDVLITMGAGDVRQILTETITRLARRRVAA